VPPTQRQQQAQETLLPPPPPPLPTMEDGVTLRDVLDAAADKRGFALLPHPRSLRVSGCEVLVLAAGDKLVAAVYLSGGVVFLHVQVSEAVAEQLRPVRPLARNEQQVRDHHAQGTWLPVSIPTLVDTVA
jgi:hypothetical protein